MLRTLCATLLVLCTAVLLLLTSCTRNYTTEPTQPNYPRPGVYFNIEYVHVSSGVWVMVGYKTVNKDGTVSECRRRDIALDIWECVTVDN